MWARVTQEGGKVEGARKGKTCSINGGCLHTYTLYIFIQGENISVIKLITKKCLTKGELLYMFAGCESEKNWSIPFLKLAIVSWFLVAQGRLFHKMAPLQLMLHLRGEKGSCVGRGGEGVDGGETVRNDGDMTRGDVLPHLGGWSESVPEVDADHSARLHVDHEVRQVAVTNPQDVLADGQARMRTDEVGAQGQVGLGRGCEPLECSPATERAQQKCDVLRSQSFSIK